MPRRTPIAVVLASSDPSARPVLAQYLDTLAAGLPGSARSRNEMIEEVADGLLDAVAVHTDAGATPARAARAATAEFGDPRHLAAQLCAEQAGRAAHRVGLGLIGTGPLVGAAWITARAEQTGLGWFYQFHTMWAEIPVLAFVLAVTVPTAMLAIGAGTGKWTHLLPVGPRGAATAGMLACLGCTAGDTTLLATYAFTAGAESTALLAPAVALSVIRLTGAIAAAHRCAALRTAAS